MEKGIIKGILATVQNDGADLTDFRVAEIDFSDDGALTKALCCVEPYIYRFPMKELDMLIFCDDSGVHDADAITTMILKIDGQVAHVVIKNLFVCKLLNGHVASLTDDECNFILGHLKITAFGYYPSRYLLFNLELGGKWDVRIRL